MPPSQLSDSTLLLGAVVFLLTLVLSLSLVVAVIVWLPPDHFAGEHARPLWAERHPAIRLGLRLLKNATGCCIVIAGLVLSLPGIPGQGLLTIVIGLMLLDFPGKRQWERKLIGHPTVLRRVNRIRRRFGKLPLKIDGGTGDRSPFAADEPSSDL